MISSLRSRLIAAFASIIFLCLFLAGTAFVIQLRDYQLQLAINQMADLSLPLSYQVSVLESAGADQEQIGDFLVEQANEVGVRILLVDTEGVVLRDTDRVLQGERLSLQNPRTLQGIRLAYWGSYDQPGGEQVFLVAPAPPPARPSANGFTTQKPSFGVVLAVAESSIIAGSWRLLPALSVAAAISLLVSIGVAFLVARSISRPIAQITRASEQIAAGNYDQHIETTGTDEVGRLAHTFNDMTREIALSHQTMKDFLANVSHELRTPLTSIQGFSQAMVDGTISQPQDYAEAGRIIGEEADRMGRMVEDLTSLSRLESGQIQMERSLLDVRELVSAAARRAQRRAEEAGIVISLAPEDDSQRQTLGDNHWLEQVLANLLDNAIRHTPRGGVITINAKFEQTSESSRGTSHKDDEWVSIQVHNTGSFIPAEDLPRVFERFYQVDKSRANGNSGLGLAIVREIAQAHGGYVDASSDRATGTTFSVWLPAASA